MKQSLVVVDAFEDRLTRQAESPMSPGYVMASSILDGSDSLSVVGVCECWTSLSELKPAESTLVNTVAKDPTKERPNRYVPASKFRLARPGEDDN